MTLIGTREMNTLCQSVFIEKPRKYSGAFLANLFRTDLKLYLPGTRMDGDGTSPEGREAR